MKILKYEFLRFCVLEQLFNIITKFKQKHFNATLVGTLALCSNSTITSIAHELRPRTYMNLILKDP